MADGGIGVTNPVYSETNEQVADNYPQHVSAASYGSEQQYVPETERALVPRAAMPVSPTATSNVQPSTMALQPAAGYAVQPANASGSSHPNVKSAMAVEKASLNQAAFKNVQMATAQVGNYNVAAVRAADVRVEEKIQQRHEIVETDQGMMLRRRVQVEYRVYAHIYEELYLEAKKEDQLALEEGGDPAVEATCSQVCTDFCCQSCVCNFQNPFARQKEKPVIAKNEIMTPVLRRGRAQGWTIYNNLIFPLIGDIIRDIWVISEFLLVLIALAFSIATFSSGKNRIFNILHLALTIVSSFLAIIDAILTLRKCKICKACYKIAKQKYTGDMDVENEEEPQNHVKDERCYKKCCNCCKETVDVVRAFLTEAILYPLLVCDIFEVITGRVYEGKNAIDRLSFALFILSCIALVLYVYLARILILIGMIRVVQSRRKPLTDDENVIQQHGYDPTIGKAALWFQSYFFIHVTGQMLAQILMFVAIGGKILYDNRHFYDPANEDVEDLPIHVSGYLWYMLVSAYVLPFLGLLSFFISTYYWVQEFPIGLCIDMVKVLQMPGPDEFVKFKEQLKEKEGFADTMVSKFVRMDKLEKQFKEMHGKQFCDKFTYSFKSPVLVFLCMVYAAMQFGFILCAALVTDEMGQIVFHFLNGGGWAIYYFLAVVIGAIANLYVFLVAGIWLLIICAVIAAIALLVACLCFCACLAGSSNDNRRQY